MSTSSTSHPVRDLHERLEAGPVLCAEGYLFELERRGYLKAGAFVPEVVLEHPDALAQVHREFVRAGSDIIEAFTYYGHREKLRQIGKEEQLEPLNRQALRLAHDVAAEFEDRPLVAGNLANTNVYRPGDDDAIAHARAMFEEQARWAAEEGADLVIGETFYAAGEARLALEVIAEVGLPGVITLALPAQGTLLDDVTIADACAALEDDGADVVGLNCFRGPATLLPPLRRILDRVSIPVAALPVPYRTTEDHPTYFDLPDPDATVAPPGGQTFPLALEPSLCTRFEVAAFARTALELGVRYLGLCCGAAPHLIRSMAEELGRTPPASRYSPDLAEHSILGTDPRLTARARDRAGDR
ncbi:MAG: homocysteine S-methyltransferase family protein [Nitriliruptoraceae bacterium]